MLIEEIRNIKSEKSDLRKFGFSVGGVFFIIGCILFWFGRGMYPYVLGLALALIIPGILIPLLLLPLQKAWMTLAVIMGWFMTRVILFALFFLVITPIAIVARIVGKHFLDLKIDRSRKSYWLIRETGTLDREGYKKQY